MSRRSKSNQKSYAENSSGSEFEQPQAISQGYQNASGRKSKYFNNSTEEEDEYDEKSSQSENYSSIISDATEDSQQSASNSDSSQQIKKKRKRQAPSSRGSGTISKHARKGSPSSDSEAKGKDRLQKGEVFIQKLPALPAGDVPYKSTTIHPNTLLFLEDLKQNNERDWFQQRDLQFRAAKSDFEDFVTAFAQSIQNHDDTIPELPVKDLVFRIYRDVRFSNDRTPYKTNMSAAFSRTGRKGNFACYYLSIEPGGKSMLGCGSWCPPADTLRAIRRHIDRHPEQWDEILQRPEFKEFFKGKEGLLESRDRLKTCPKGYEKNHKRIDLLKLKSFTVGMNFSDDEVRSDEFLQIADVVVQQMVPFVTLLNGIIAPDELSSTSEAEDE